MQISSAHRPTWAVINLDYLAFNFHSVKKFVGENLGYMAVVKADAYGHGAICCARRLAAEGIDWFGVALPEEGLELRENNVNSRILCLGGFWQNQENLLLEHNLTPVIFNLELAEKFNRAASDKNLIADVHIKIDTGMGRIGVRFDAVKDFAEHLKHFQNLRVEGIMTHLAAADNLGENDFTNLQIERFHTAAAIFKEKGFDPVYQDLANSPGAVAHENSRGNLVRLGGVLYGLGDDVLPKEIVKPDLKPVMSLHTRIAQLKSVPQGETLGYGRTFQTVKSSIIATVPIGYQDGYLRGLSNRGHAIVGGRYAPIVGRISMDWTILDVSDIAGVKVNDEVILIGETGELKVTTEEIAHLAETISYELTCGISRRVFREYVESR